MIRVADSFSLNRFEWVFRVQGDNFSRKIGKFLVKIHSMKLSFARNI